MVPRRGDGPELDVVRTLALTLTSCGVVEDLKEEKMRGAEKGTFLTGRLA